MKKKGFTIIELLVVLAVIGVFAGIAYPNISNWITDRNVKKEVYETVTFIKERKAEAAHTPHTGKLGVRHLSACTRSNVSHNSSGQIILVRLQ